MKIENSDGISANMSSLSGYVTTTYEELVQTFGPPTYECNDLRDKIQTEWCLRLDGVVCTIYNWKTEGTPMGRYDWHIGGYGRGEVELVKQAISEHRQS